MHRHAVRQSIGKATTLSLLTEALVLYEAVKSDAEDSGKVIREELDWCEAMISFKFHKCAARTRRSTRRITSR